MTEVLSVHGLSKSFSSHTVLSEISFSIECGEVFGILGPNGAGKTTLLRIIMDIIRVDEGKVKMFNRIMDERMKDRVGYLPEERGLYKGLTVIDSLVYFATLKGMNAPDARKSAMAWLERIHMAPPLQ
ncbi:MAG: ATP-binding cassette domain-containing protein [Candidatus Micrarchaeota archaeon]